MRTEIKDWDFEKVKANAQQLWNTELNKIVINASEDTKINFYTAMYHTSINPTVYSDVNGQYKGVDQNIHVADGFTNYTTFSLWDTYRALHPLFNILQPSRNNDMVKSMMAHYNQSAMHMLPIWSLYSNDTWCMSGYHSVSVVADAIIKGVYNGNANEALDACVITANHRNYDGIGYYIDLGFIPAEKTGVSVSNTLEYAYDDWCIAQLAKKLNRQDVYEKFIHRSGNWENNFDSATGFMQPKLADGTFKNNFDALTTSGQGFIEGNSWNYSFFVPQNPTRLIAKMGGKTAFAARLDTLFSMHLPDSFFAETEDITREGIIGGYVHGNEPAHHVAYFYNWVNQPWKTQYRVRNILAMQYKPTPDGLGGNDDCGQMSALYIFSALGFYPFAPGSNEYAIGSPLVNNAVLTLENGATFTIEAINQSDSNVYVQKVLLNNKSLSTLFINYNDITAGGKLTFYMGAKPRK